MSLSDIIGKIRKKTNEVWQRESEEYKQSGNYKPSSEYGTSGGQDNTSAPSVLNSGGISPSPFDSSSWLDRYHNVVEPNREAREQIESDMDFLYPLRNAGTLDWRLEQQKQKAERAANYTFPNSADKDTFNPNPDIAGAMDDAAGLPTETEDQKRLRELRERREQYDYFPSEEARVGFNLRPQYGTIPDSLLQDWQREAIDKSIEFEEKRNVRDANEHPILSSYESVAGNLLNAAMFPYAIADYLSTGRLNEDAKYNDMGKRASTIRSTVGGNINSALGGGFLGDAGEFLYGTGMSMIDSAARTALFGKASIGVAGMGAATDAMREGQEKGYSDDRAFWQGIAAGVLEGAFEKLPTDALFDTDMLKKSVGGYIAKNALSEGVEEGGTTISNKIVDYLGGLLEGSNNSDVVNTYNKHRANNESNGRAIVNTLIDIGGEVLLDTIGGLLSGGSMAGVGAGVDTLDYKTSGKRVYSELLNFLKGTGEDSKTANTQMVLDYSKVLGKAGQTVINEMYDPDSGVTALDYIPEMTKYYEAGRNGAAMNSVTAKPDTNVTAEMRQAAYIAGQSDARTSTAPKTRTGAKTSESAQANANRANSSDGAQVSNITSNAQTAQNDRTDLDTQKNAPADTQATRASHVQTTSTAGLGIDGGSTTDSVSVINGRLTKAMKTAQQIVSERGKQLVLVSGNMNVDDQSVRGIVVGNKMFVQADNPQFTSEQIVRNVLEDGRIDLDTQQSILADNDIEIENDTQEVQNNDEQTGTAEVGVRRGGERTDSAYSGRQTGEVAEGTGQTESGRRAVRGTAKDGGAAALTYGEEVSVADLGIGSGSATDMVRLVTGGDTKFTKKAKKIARKSGLRLVFVDRDMIVSGKLVRGYLSGDRMFVNVNHPDFTADQIARHEAAHNKINQGIIDVDAIKTEISEKYDVAKVCELYASAYASADMTEDQIFVEIVCDAEGDMNIFEGVFSNAALPYSRLLQDVKQQAELQSKKTRGPPKVKQVDGVAYSPEVAKVMESEEYHKPMNYLDAMSQETMDDWAKSYVKQFGQSDVIDIMSEFVNKQISDPVIQDYLPHGSYQYTKRGPLRSNIEYIVSFDLDTSCPRTFQFLRYRDAIQRAAGRYLTYNESINLIELMRAYRQNIPCTYCYVENKRILLQSSYLSYFDFRQDVMNAATDEEAMPKMYGYSEGKGLTSAAQKVFDRWRKGTSYNPTSTEVWEANAQARNSVLNYLDKNGQVKQGNKALVNMVCSEFGISDAAAKREIESYVKDWKYSKKANIPHIYTVANTGEISDIDERALALHREAMNYSKSVSQAKSVENYVPYTDQLKNISAKNKAYINGMGGIRKHSSNDFRIDYVTDYFQFYADLAAGGWMGHTYTKSVDFVKIFGRCGDRINMSIAMEGNTLETIRENTLEGMNWRDAKELRKAYSNAGVMAMVTNDAQLSYALNADWIDMIIPFHASSLTKGVMDLRMWIDYASRQNEMWFSGAWMKNELSKRGIDASEMTGPEITKAYLEATGKKMILDKDGNPVKPHFLPGDTYINGQLVPGHGNDVNRYKQLCDEYGVRPRFDGVMVENADGETINVVDHPNYLKLIKETARTDTKQEAIKFNFNEYDDNLGMSPFDYALKQLHDHAQIGGYENLKDDPWGIVDEFIKEYLNKDRPLGWLSETAKWVQEYFAEQDNQESSANDALSAEPDPEFLNLRNENAELKKQVEHWLKQVTVTKNPVLSEKSAQKSADKLLEKYESSADAADIAQELKTLGEGIISKENPFSWKAVKTKAIDIAQSIIGEGGNTDTDFDASLAEEYIANDVINMVTGSALRQVSPTIADKYEAAIAKTKIRETKKRIDAVERVRERSKKAQDAKIAALKEKHKNQMSELRAEKNASKKEALEKLRDEKNEKIKELKDDQKKAEAVKRILDHTRRMSDKLLRPTDSKHIPQKFHDTVARLLEAINLEDTTEYEYTADGEYKRVKAGDVLGAEPTRRTAAFRELREIYRSMRDEFVIDADFEGTSEQKGLLEAVIDMENIPIKAMSLEQLDTVYKTIRAIEGMITNYNKLFYGQRWRVVSDAAGKLRLDNIDKRHKKSWAKSLRPVQNGLTLDMLMPNTYLHMMGETGDEIFRMMRNAQDREIRMIESAIEFNRKLFKDIDINKIVKTSNKVTLGGRETTASTAELLEIYVLSKREASLEHFTDGGTMLESYTDTKGKRIEYNTPIRNISEAEIRDIESYLRKNYSELVDIADKMQDYLSTTVAKWGNDESMRVYGYEKFGEKNYWKIRSNDQDLQKSVEKDFQITSVAHKGFTRALTPHANTSIYIGSIFDTYLDHILEMANYAAWLGTLEDINRIRNFKFKDGEGNRIGTSHELFDIVHGKGGERYLSKLLADISHSSVKLDSGSMFNALIGKGKAAAVGANLSVVLQQPTAGLRALSMINPAYLAGGVFTKNGWEKAKKYTAISQWKDWGYFDISTGRQLGDLMLGNASVLDKISNKLMWAAGAMDSLTWGTIWGACELETKHRRKDLKAGSEEFYQEVAKRFTEIIDQTQVVDGILQRNGYMRNPDSIAKMSTSFMSEAVKIYNMVYSAGYDIMAAQTPEARKKALRAFSAVAVSVTISNVVNAAVKSLVDALRNSDKEKKYWEKWLDEFWGLTGEEETVLDYTKAVLDSNLLSSFNPATYIPYIKDVLSIIQGFSVTRMDMDSIESVIKSVINFTKAVNGDGKYTIANASANVFAELSRLLGLPVANIKRDVLAAVQTLANKTDNYLIQYRIDKALYNLNFSANKSSFMVTLYGAYKNDPEAYDIIYSDMYDDIYPIKLREVEADPDVEPEDYPKEARERTLSWFRSAIEAKMKAEEGVKSVEDLSSRWLTPEQTKEYNSVMEELGIQNGEAKKYAENKASGSSEGQYDALAEAYDSDEETYNAIYDDMISSGVTENEIRSAIETRWKKEQNVKDVEELDKRWLSPDEEDLYDSVLGDIQSSSLWARASKDLKAETLEKLYDLAVKTDTETSAGSRMQAKIDGGRAYGIDEGDYILYLMARSMADKPNDNGNLGTYTNDEIKAAIDMLGLSASASAYLWEAAGKNEKSNPWR